MLYHTPIPILTNISTLIMTGLMKLMNKPHHESSGRIVLALLFSMGLLSASINTASAVSNDEAGRIYIQKSFGDISNCGPIAALMAVKFINKNFNVDSADQRALLKRARKIVEVERTLDTSDDENIVNISAWDMSIDSHWWRMSDIKIYLTHNDVQFESIQVTRHEVEPILDALDGEGIVIVNVNMNDIPLGFKIGKPYITLPIPGGWGHFLVVVGYKTINGRLAFEIHDSYSSKGKSRYFYADDIMYGINRHYREVVVVNKGLSLDHMWASAQW